jgi:hypothetical protein
MSTSANSRARCAYRSRSGRRCRNNASLGWNMCDSHCDFHHARASAAEIVSNRDRLDTAEGILAMMGRITRALAAGKILARDATAMLYAGQTMLYALPRVLAEREKIFIAKEEEVWRNKVLAEAHHDILNCEESVEEGNKDAS